MKTLIALCLLFLTACSSGAWMKPGSTQQSFNIDSYECERDQRMASYSFYPPQLYPPAPNAYGMAGVGLSSFGSSANQIAFYFRCMESKGYVWTADDAPPQPEPVAVFKPVPEPACRRTLPDGKGFEVC